jgi:hypothetical protein
MRGKGRQIRASSGTGLIRAVRAIAVVIIDSRGRDCNRRIGYTCESILFIVFGDWLEELVMA